MKRNAILDNLPDVFRAMPPGTLIHFALPVCRFDRHIQKPLRRLDPEDAVYTAGLVFNCTGGSLSLHVDKNGPIPDRFIDISLSDSERAKLVALLSEQIKNEFSLSEQEAIECAHEKIDRLISID